MVRIINYNFYVAHLLFHGGFFFNSRTCFVQVKRLKVELTVIEVGY